MRSSVETLWTAVDAADATGGKAVSNWNASGVSIDSRTLKSGDLFVALSGPNFDGHDYVIDALSRGASASLISRRPKGLNYGAPVLEVNDTFLGLNQLGIAARARAQGKIIAITGSVGKTGVKEAIANLLSRQATVSYSLGGLNNQFGVPLSLARLPKNAEFGVFELGMNHTGELTELSRMVKPLVAVVTTVELAHLQFFSSFEEIARAKAEIFTGLQEGGIAIINRDNLGYDILKNVAISVGAEIVTFGSHQEADFKLISFELGSEYSLVKVSFGQFELSYKLKIPGYHWILNSLAVLAAIHCAGGNVFKAAQSFGNVTAIKGRGSRQQIKTANFTFDLIDDSYNASPVSVKAALNVLSRIKLGNSGRRIVVLGDMLELGSNSQALHIDLATTILETKIDLVYAVGPNMINLFDALPTNKQGHWSKTPENLLKFIVPQLQSNDVILVKGSLGVRMSLIIDGLVGLGARG